MSWFLEHLNRDGSVGSRIAIAAPDPGEPRILRIGRALDNDLVIDDPHCAPHHARLEFDLDGKPHLVDLDTRNGIADARGQRRARHDIDSDAPFRLGHALVRIRSSEWPVAPELPLSRRPVWPFALLAFLLVMGHEAWDVWLKDVTSRTPQYLYSLAAMAVGLGIWSGVYALLGRLISGMERFFSHLAVACTGYLSGAVILWLLDTLAFASSWLWPVQIQQAAVVIVAAFTVRFHLRLADPRHWPTLRIAVVLVALVAIAIPIGQQWLSHKRLTDVQTLQALRHPALRVAEPRPPDAFSEHARALRAKVDKLRGSNADSTPEWGSSDD